MNGDERTVYEQMSIALVMGALTIALGVHKEPTWIEVPELADLMEQGGVLLDTRPAIISGSKTLPRAIAIPGSELEERIDEVPQDRPVIVFGSAGGDSRPYYELLRRRGYDAHDLGPMNRFPRSGVHRHDHDEEH